jgi:hypothetical protein
MIVQIAALWHSVEKRAQRRRALFSGFVKRARRPRLSGRNGLGGQLNNATEKNTGQYW